MGRGVAPLAPGHPGREDIRSRRGGHEGRDGMPHDGIQGAGRVGHRVEREAANGVRSRRGNQRGLRCPVLGQGTQGRRECQRHHHCRGHRAATDQEPGHHRWGEGPRVAPPHVLRVSGARIDAEAALQRDQQGHAVCRGLEEDGAAENQATLVVVEHGAGLALQVFSRRSRQGR